MTTNNSTNPAVPDTAIAKQPALVKYVSEQLGRLKTDDYFYLLKQVIVDSDYDMSKEIFDDIVKSFGDLTTIPVPKDIIEFLFGFLNGDDIPYPDLDEHSYTLIIRSLAKLIDRNEEPRLIRAIITYLDNDSDLKDDQKEIISVLHKLTEKSN